ncbi:MAG: HU family DNA-binding protein, partial [Planctomycetales bacterium]|nr:HU family DNA-binding protein [Planctomycetales bacterium]
REAKEVVELFFEEVRASLEANEQVKLSGFGNFDFLRNLQDLRNLGLNTAPYSIQSKA